MKKMISIAALVLLVVCMVSCTTIVPNTATSNALGAKVGEASGTYILGFIPMSLSTNMGIQKAAKNGGITKISTVDTKVSDFIFWTTVTTVVTGE